MSISMYCYLQVVKSSRAKRLRSQASSTFRSVRTRTSSLSPYSKSIVKSSASSFESSHKGMAIPYYKLHYILHSTKHLNWENVASCSHWRKFYPQFFFAYMILHGQYGNLYHIGENKSFFNTKVAGVVESFLPWNSSAKRISTFKWLAS